MAVRWQCEGSAREVSGDKFFDRNDLNGFTRMCDWGVRLTPLDGTMCIIDHVGCLDNLSPMVVGKLAGIHKLLHHVNESHDVYEPQSLTF